MVEQEELGRFLVALAGEYANNVTRGLKNIDQSFANQLAGLLTVIKAQGVSQVVGSFDGEPNKYRECIKSIGKYVSLVEGDDNKSKKACLPYQQGCC